MVAEVIIAWCAFTYAFNTTGQPAMSLPAGTDDETGLPTALQIVGRPAGEETLFSLAAAIEAAAPWHGRRPAV